MSGGRGHALVLATTHLGKLEELRALLGDLPLQLFTTRDFFAGELRVTEDADTFAGNAVKKAVAVARVTLTMTLADDSGLEVDALEGRPGVRSARFAGERATDAENNAALLRALDDLGDPATSSMFPARFRCALALLDPYAAAAAPIVVEGVCEGSLTRSPRGSRGFGYDPLFVVNGMGKTMAELTSPEKASVSHRARAAEALRPVLAHVLSEREALIERIGRR